MYTHYWQLNDKQIEIYSSENLETKIRVVPLLSIRKSIYQEPNVEYRELRAKNINSKFHLITDEHEFHCGMVDIKKNRDSAPEIASNFYNIYKFISST